MTVAEKSVEELAEIEQRLGELIDARTHPADLLQRVCCIDNTTGEGFRFELLDESKPWHWQRELLDEWIASSKAIDLKARQIGITWLAGGYGLWYLLMVPGSKVLVVSINEAEAIKIINRVWDMLQSLPKHLWNGAQVLKPVRVRPSKEIQLQHQDGRISTMIGLPSTASAGHGETAALVILDEFSRQEYAAETWKAVLPTTQGGGKVLVISTGNGVSNERGGGNFFHHLYSNADEYGLVKRFLPWDLHPDRDERWYRTHARALKPDARGEQYPRNELEAFILTGHPFFDPELLIEYEQLVPKPLYRFDWMEEHDNKGFVAGRRSEWENGRIRVYSEPKAGRQYAIGADVATGRGYDYSAAYVIDLAEMDIVAEYHAKQDPDLYAEQLHFLGRWYNTAILAVEVGGGYGESVLIPLRDGRAGRPPYPKLYQHVLSARPDLPTMKPFGFPINMKTRTHVISVLEQAMREHVLPFLTDLLLGECRTFVHADTGASPRAQEGCNDDCVMALAIALEMYRQRGKHEARDQRRKLMRKPRGYETLYPWQERGAGDKAFDRRYAKEMA